ncbi:MAG: histidinol-phosphate aminotransferase family protein [Sedimentisphaerales bacterium]|nr:histidinol-phosphate aminotransferase family protein [Sedimentisphaerales bacterium]
MNGLVNLSMNEMPFLPPNHVVSAAREGLSKLNRYAGQEDLKKLRDLLACYTGVPESYIIPGPGSDCLLREIIYAYSGGRKLVMASPSFLPTVQKAKQFSTKLVSIRISPPKFQLNPDSLLDELTEPTLVIIDNPNNPSGSILIDLRTVKAVLRNKNALLVIDEAYFEFSEVTFANLVIDHPNLVITRTLDKAFGLAGARVGYLVAGEYFLNAFAQFSFFLPQSSTQAAIAALQSSAYMKENVQFIVTERKRVLKKMLNLGATVCPSRTNFLLVLTDIPDMALKLKDMGILISDVSGQFLSGSIRVSVGLREENDAFIDAYQKIIETRN